MKREWKPGDVALIEVGCHANRHVGMFTEAAWRYADDKWVQNDPAIVIARPLAVIDAEDHEQVERFWKVWRDLAPDHRLAQDNLVAALREFANPTPPKPEEPTGLGAVVEDSDGGRWVRVDDPHYPWVRPLRDEGAYTQRSKWEWIDAVRILSPGVEA